MADAKITELTELTTADAGDLLAIVDDPSGTPVTKKITRSNLLGTLIEYGQIYTDAGAGSQTLSNGSFTLLNQFDSNGQSSSEVTPDASNNKITVTNTGIYFVSFSLSFSGTGSVEWEGHVYWNNTVIPQCAFKRKLGTSGDIGTVATQGIVDVTVGSTDFDVRVEPDGASKDIAVAKASLNIFRIAST